MKFGARVGYDKLYCVTKNQPHIAYLHPDMTEKLLTGT